MITTEKIIEKIKRDIPETELNERDFTYTFADAIREGSKHTKQLNGGYVQGEEACAIGAAILAAAAREWIQLP